MARTALFSFPSPIQMPAQLPSSRRGYGLRHKRLRKSWPIKVARGGVTCARCGKPIDPHEPWDLGHDDLDRTKYNGPEHRRCNRATVTNLRAALTPEVPRHSREW
jgi:hypothetical protein